MSYIVQRKQHFYVVAYNGCDPIPGTERRRWHPAGSVRADAEAMKSRIDRSPRRTRSSGTLGGFAAGPWLDSKPTITHPTRAGFEPATFGL